MIELKFYYIAVATLFIVGIKLISQSLFSSRLRREIGYRKDATYRLQSLREAIKDKSVDPLFLKLGLKISMRKYLAIRKIIISFIMLLSALKAYEAYYREALLLFVISFLVLRMSEPKLQNYRGKKTFFAIVTESALKRRHEKLDEELTTIIMQMKNIIISKQVGISAVYIITRLIPFTNLSKDAFSASLRYVRQGQMTKAADSFSDQFGTKLGGNFSRILLKLDNLPPVEFLDQLTSLQKTAMEQHNTRTEKRLMTMQNYKRSLAYLEALLIMGIFLYMITIDSLQALNTLG